MQDIGFFVHFVDGVAKAMGPKISVFFYNLLITKTTSISGLTGNNKQYPVQIRQNSVIFALFLFFTEYRQKFCKHNSDLSETFPESDCGNCFSFRRY